MIQTKIKFIVFLLIFHTLLLSCTEKPIPLDREVWSSWVDATVDSRRYNMSVWMIKTNRFENKTKQDIIENLPERRPYEIKSNIETFCIKQTTEGWNIDFNSHPLAYLDIYFDDDGKVIKALIRERKQTFGDKMDGKGRISTDFKTTFIRKKDY